MVAIKDFGMPSCCVNCDMCLPCALNEGLCHVTQHTLGDIYDKRPSDCPLVEIEERKVEKCTDCNEYNQEKHYCPKFCDVIRDTTKEMQEFYKGEHEKLEKIEQIMNKESEGYIQNNPCLREIRKVLEQDS